MRPARPEIFILEELYRVHHNIDPRQLVRVKEVDERLVTLVDRYLMNHPNWDVSRLASLSDRLTYLRVHEIDGALYETTKVKIELIFEQWPRIDVVYHLSIKQDSLTERDYGPDYWFDYTPTPAGSYSDLTQFPIHGVIIDANRKQMEFLEKYEADKR